MSVRLPFIPSLPTWAALWWAVPVAWVVGVAAQLQQPALWSEQVYGLFCAIALVLIGLLAAVFNGSAIRHSAAGHLAAGHSAAGHSAVIHSAASNSVARFSLARASAVGIGGVCLAVAVMGAASTGWRAVAKQQQVLVPSLEGRTWLATGRVADLPRATPRGWRFEFELEALAPVSTSTPPALATPLRWPDRVVLSWSAADASGLPRAGERWRLPVRLRAPQGLKNPHGFDTELWMWEQGLGASGSVRLGPKEPMAERLSPAPWGLLALRAHLRDGLAATVADGRVAGVLSALVVGDQAAIERADWDVFRATGVAHLFSISGLHITLWAWLVRWCVVWLWRALPRWSPLWGTRVLLACPAPVAAAWGGWALALAYAVFSGWGVPAQRTVLMLGVVLGLGLLGRRWPWPLVGVVTMAVVLAWDPWAWLQPGFWLSFVAVGVLLAAERAPPASGLWATARELLRTQWRMTLALAPLTLALFGQVSVVGLVANLVAIPVVTVLVTPLALAGALWSGAWMVAAWVLGALLAGLQALAHWPWASLSWPAAPWPLAVLAVVGAGLAVLRWPAPLRVLGLMVVLPVLVWRPERPPMGEFEVVAVDVGQGAAVLIRTATASVLYDAGPQWGPDTDAGQRVVLPLLQALGERPQRVVLSHRDGDHVGGALAVLNHLAGQVAVQVWASFDPADVVSGLSDPVLAHAWTARWREARGPVERGPLAWTRCLAGQTWEQDGVRFELLHPAPALYEQPTSTNNRSCVLRVQGAQRAALLTGDMDARHEAALVNLSTRQWVGQLVGQSLGQSVNQSASQSDGQSVSHAVNLRADWLLSPHHGSHTSSSEAFLRAVQPRWVVVQAGHQNRYGHPAPVVLGRYQALGLRWVDTPHCGAARWRSDQPEAMRCERLEWVRYWHWAGAEGS